MGKTVTIRLTAKQIEIIRYSNNFLPRITILEGAVRSGKTFLNNILWLLHIRNFADQKKKFIMTGNTLGSIKRNVLDDLSVTFNINTTLNSKNEFTVFGNTVICFGSGQSNSHKSIKGFTAYGWYGNEITEHHAEAIKQAFARCSGEGARIFWDTNPSSPSHYIKTQYIDKSENIDGSQTLTIKAWHFVLEDNPFLPKDYIESLKKSLPENSVWYKRNILGLWVSAENVIYSNYTIKEYNIGNLFNDVDEWIAGLDFGHGGISPFAFILIARIGSRYILYDEAYRAGGLNYEFIRLVETKLARLHADFKKHITIYADSADRDKITEWHRAGFHIFGAIKNPNSVNAGIECVLAQDIVIHPRCINAIREIQNYQWDSDKDGNVTDTPIKYDDHIMDAMRYAVYTHTRRLNISTVDGTRGSGISTKRR
jgi:PBSX family phage terminase large subunit